MLFQKQIERKDVRFCTWFAYRKDTAPQIDIIRVSEYNIHMADLAVEVQDDQSAKSFVTPCSCAGRFLSLWRCLYGVYVYC